MHPLPIGKDGTITLPAQVLNGSELDDLLHQLALTRAQMTPVVPEHVPHTGQVLTVEDPTVRMAALEGSDRLTMLFRHPAYSWQQYSFTFDAAERLHDALGAFINRSSTRPKPFVSGGQSQH